MSNGGSGVSVEVVCREKVENGDNPTEAHEPRQQIGPILRERVASTMGRALEQH